MTLKIVSPN